MRYQELLFTASVLGAAIALHNCRHPGNYALRTVDFPARNSATIELTTIHTAAVPDEESPSQTRPQRTQSEQMSFGVTPESRRRPMPEACLKRVTSGCSRLAQSWSDLLSGADVFDGLSVILVRTMSGRPGSGNALPLHLRDRHQHTSVYLFHPFSCPVLTLVQLSDGERFLYSRLLQRDAQAAHNLSLRKRD
jgi:hypothetical protein